MQKRGKVVPPRLQRGNTTLSSALRTKADVTEVISVLRLFMLKKAHKCFLSNNVRDRGSS